MSNEMSKQDGIEYIRKQLVEGKLVMADATEKTGWSFPRIRSRAITLCKKLGGSLQKEERGVYILQPDTKVPTATIEVEDAADKMAAAEEALLDDAMGRS